jgi:hypothetical protein
VQYGKTVKENPCQDIPDNISHPEFQTPLQCAVKSFEGGICAPWPKGLWSIWLEESM